jgi:hypothetical protein
VAKTFFSRRIPFQVQTINCQIFSNRLMNSNSQHSVSLQAQQQYSALVAEIEKYAKNGDVMGLEGLLTKGIRIDANVIQKAFMTGIRENKVENSDHHVEAMEMLIKYLNVKLLKV